MSPWHWCMGRGWTRRPGDSSSQAWPSPFVCWVYDRRGHSRSERPGSHRAASMRTATTSPLCWGALELAPAHVVTSSSGGSIALRAGDQASRCLPLSVVPRAASLGSARGRPREPGAAAARCSEPRGRSAGGSPRAIAGAGRGSSSSRSSTVLAPGMTCYRLRREGYLHPENAPTFLDELKDRDVLKIEEGALSRLEIPVLLSDGSESLHSVSASNRSACRADPSRHARDD